MAGPFTVTVLEDIKVRISNGNIHGIGEVFVIDMKDVDQQLYEYEQLGYVDISPPLPQDPQSLAEYQSALDRDPVYPFLIERIEGMESSIHKPVQTFAALKAIAAEERADKMVCLVEDEAATYRFDIQSALADDAKNVLIPNDITHPSPGRWIKYTAGHVIPAIHDPVTTIAQLRAVPSNERSGDMMVFVGDKHAGYRFKASDIALDDGNTTIKPDDIVHPSPGRWVKFTAGSAMFAIHDPVDTLAELRGIPANERSATMVVMVADEDSGYFFDPLSAIADDDNNVIIPNDITHPSPGRWVKFTAIHAISSIHAPVDTLAELRDIPANERAEHMQIVVGEKKAGYRWDPDDTEADDDNSIVIPDDIAFPDPGRWRKYTGVGAEFFSSFTV